MLWVPHKAKWYERMSHVTTTPVSDALVRLSIRIVLVSQPPLELSGVPTNTTAGEPCHGSGLECGLPGWCVS